MSILINYMHCVMCKECIEICENDVYGITQAEGSSRAWVSIINPDDCNNCMDCVETCDTNAIIID